MTNWLINSRPSGSSKVDPIFFTEEDMRDVHYPHCDALVVRAVMARNGLGRMLVDNGSSVNVIFLSTYEQMNIDVPLGPCNELIYGFKRDCVTPKEIVRLAVTMGEGPLATHTFMEFSSRQKISLLQSLRQTSLEGTLDHNIHSPPLHGVLY
ncbi:Uncharacterized protein Adt_32096 [Abeliophyllum distichum]|uniref:Uncharacterized protein n=1 Tax=Abeliophyllum distichum TaxID=126358 RepID=A0ABD1RG14_9LAMI